MLPVGHPKIMEDISEDGDLTRHCDVFSLSLAQDLSQARVLTVHVGGFQGS